MSYIAQEHPNGKITALNTQRQTRKALRATLGQMSGRQWKKHYKALKRAATNGTLVSTSIVDDQEQP